MLPSNSNKIIKKASVKKVSSNKRKSTKVSDTFFDKKVAAKKKRQEKLPAKQKYKRNSKSKNPRKLLLYLSLF